MENPTMKTQTQIENDLFINIYDRNIKHLTMITERIKTRTLQYAADFDKIALDCTSIEMGKPIDLEYYKDRIYDAHKPATCARMIFAFGVFSKFDEKINSAKNDLVQAVYNDCSKNHRFIETFQHQINLQNW